MDACGLYRAPAAFGPGVERLDVLASEYALGSCADCCPYAEIVLYPVR